VNRPLAPPVRPNRLRLVLLGLIGLTMLALAGLVVAGLLSKPAEVAYQNDQYQVLRRPRRLRCRSRIPMPRHATW
jgi:hypothetical protein